MAKLMGFFVCIVVLVLDLAAGFCGIEAEMAQNREKQLRLWMFECKQPSHDAFLLGLAGAGLMAVAHAIATLLGGCNCICSQDDFQKASSSRQLTTVCFVLSWIVLVIGFSMLVVGALANNKSRGSCGFTHHHIFSLGGILCFVHALFCIAFYASATSSH